MKNKYILFIDNDISGFIRPMRKYIQYIRWGMNKF